MRDQPLVSLFASFMLLTATFVWSANVVHAQMGMRPKVLDFYADWCVPCKELLPVMKKVQAKYNDVDVVSVNIDDPQNGKLIAEYGVTALPTCIFLDGDGQMCAMTAGYNGPDNIYWGIKQISDRK